MINEIEQQGTTPSLSYTPKSHILHAMGKANSSREVIRLSRTELTHDLFDYLWSESRYPFVVSGMQEVLQFTYGPEMFRSPQLAKQPCIVEDCSTGHCYPSTVGEYFMNFDAKDEKEEAETIKV